MDINHNQQLQKQIDIVSNANWDFCFEIIQLWMNDIHPSDLEEYSPSRNIREYFKNKFQLQSK